MQRSAAIAKARRIIAERMLKANPTRIYVQLPADIGPNPDGLVLRVRLGTDLEVGIHA